MVNKLISSIQKFSKYSGVFMLKKLTILSVSLVIVPALGMEKTSNMQPWVQQASTIRIEHSVWGQDLDIDDTTTILDLKNKLFGNKGIPVEGSVLRPSCGERSSRWVPYSLMPKPGRELKNDENVKEIMHSHGVNCLALFLTLQSVLE